MDIEHIAQRNITLIKPLDGSQCIRVFHPSLQPMIRIDLYNREMTIEETKKVIEGLQEAVHIAEQGSQKHSS